jgi:hypothetical protein
MASFSYGLTTHFSDEPEFIIAMAFRINSANSKALREWAIKEILRPKAVFLQTPQINQDYQWN